MSPFIIHQFYEISQINFANVLIINLKLNELKNNLNNIKTNNILNKLIDVKTIFFVDTTELLKTVLNVKTRNTRLEEDFTLACLDIEPNYDCNHHSPPQSNKIQQVVHNIDIPSINESLILPYTTLEESNFKSQFFVTRSSFNVSHQYISLILI